MRFSEIFRNLTDYNEPLESVEVNGRRYRTEYAFKPTISMGFSFGENDNATDYNPKIAKALVDAGKFFGEMPILVQHEVGESLRGLCGKLKDNMYVFGPKWELQKVSTYEILELMAEKIDKEGLNKQRPVYSMHPAHAFRTLEITKKAGLEGSLFICDEVSWPAENKHAYFVRSPALWIPREILARVHHKLHGWVE
jgi:hypothetical protein